MRQLFYCLLFSCATQLPMEDFVEQPTPKASLEETSTDLLALTPKDSPEYPVLLARQCQAYEESSLRAFRLSVSAEDMLYANPTNNAELKEAVKTSREAYKREEQQAISCYRELASGYPDYERRDEALFILGYLLQKQSPEKPAEALTFFQAIIKEYPKSKYLSASLLALADNAFHQHDILTALAIYQKIEAMPEARERGYALYMTGWCYHNLSRFEEALAVFVKIVKESKGKSDAATLEREARLQIVMLYANIGDLKKAEAFFLSLGDAAPVPKMLKDLADQYYSIGKLKDFTEVCRFYNTTYKEMDEVCALPVP